MTSIDQQTLRFLLASNHQAYRQTQDQVARHRSYCACDVENPVEGLERRCWNETAVSNYPCPLKCWRQRQGVRSGGTLELESDDSQEDGLWKAQVQALAAEDYIQAGLKEGLAQCSRQGLERLQAEAVVA